MYIKKTDSDTPKIAVIGGGAAGMMAAAKAAELGASVTLFEKGDSLFLAAGIGIAVSNACKDALAAADLITVSNEENAIAKIIYDLDSGSIVC